MIYPPLIAFFLALIWMVWSGYDAKKKYYAAKRPEFGQPISPPVMHLYDLDQASLEQYQHYLRAWQATGRKQGQTPEPAEALGGGKQSRVPTQERTPEWKM